MTTLQTALTVATTATTSGTLAAGKHTPVNATSAALTMTLPTPATIGARLRVEKVDASANAVTVSGTIRGGASTIILAWQYESVELFAESLTSWRVVAGHKTKAALDAAYAGQVTDAAMAGALGATTAGAVAARTELKAAFTAGRAPYLGPVANRGRIPSGSIATSSYRQYKTWRVYRATDKIPAVALVYAGFAGLAENSATATGSVSAVVEYPMGTYNRVTFGGTNIGTIPPNGMVQSDLTALTSAIPAGARFWIGTFVTWDAGTQCPRFQDSMAWDTTAATAMRESASASGTVSLTDDLMTGARVSTGISSKTGDGYGPSAILGMTQRATVFIAGDSRAMAQFPPYMNAQDAEGITGEVEQILANRIGYINAGLNSDSHGLANTTGAYTNRLALSAFCTHIIDQYGVNSIYGQTVTQNTTDLTTFRNKFPAGKPYIKTTVTPKVTGTWHLADLSDQTPFATLANYTGWNQFIRNGANGLIDGCIDLEAVVSPQLNSGKIAPAQRIVTDAAITSGTATLTSATAAFNLGDIGKWVGIVGAGAAGAYLTAVIDAVTNATTVTLKATDATVISAGTTVTGATAGIGLSSYDGVHQTKLRENAIRDAVLLRRAVDPFINAAR